MQYTALGDTLAPAKEVSCISDLPAMYEASTVEDLYEVYQALGLGDGEVFTCVTVAGKEDPALAKPVVAAALPAESDAGMRAAAAAAASLGMAMTGGMAIAEALKKMGGGGPAAAAADSGIDVK
jgi:hypothetical protein